MLLRKAQGNCSIGGYIWENDGDVVDVPYWMAEELLSIKGAGFSEVVPDEQSTVDEGDEEAEGEEEPAKDEDGDGVPDGTAPQVLAWVGDSKERAALALAAEEAKGDVARATLVSKLTKLAA